MAKGFSGYSQEYAQKLVESEQHLPANCFTLGRFGGPVEGIVLSLERGSDPFRPWEPHVSISGYRVHRDRINGCIYAKQGDGKTATTRRASVRQIEASDTRVYYTLVKPEVEKPGTSIVFAHCGLPHAKTPVKVNERELRLFAGVVGGTTIGRNGLHALIELMEGETMAVFYEDGAVRQFRRQGTSLTERHLTNEEMLHERISHAWTSLEQAERIEDGERQERVLRAILSGMADVFHLTTRFDQRGLGQGMRVTLMRDLFLGLSPQVLSLIHNKLTAILHQVDPPLLSMLREGGSPDTDGLPNGVADIADARDKRDRAKREAERASRRAERIAKQPPKGSGGQKQKQTTNPKKLAKLERKLSQRK